MSSIWIDRDLSWIEFNRRVLAEAVSAHTPLLERAKFLAIFSSNLDEFFMKRIAALREEGTPEGQRLICELRRRLLPLLQQQSEYIATRLVPELSQHGIHLRGWAELTANQRREASDYFLSRTSPALTPLVIHPSQPFPFFSNLSLSLAFCLHDDRVGESVDARVKVPSALPQWVPLTADVPETERLFVHLQEVIRENADQLYPGMRLSSPTLFRLTRDAEVAIEDDEERSVHERVRQQLRQRRFEPAVRLEFGPGTDARLKQLLQDRFGLTDDDVYELPGGVDATSLMEIAALPIPALRDPAWAPLPVTQLQDHDSIFDAIAAGDVLVHHPYDSFDDSVERFIRTAAQDPATIVIKMTVYRVGDDTPFVKSLIKAAESGKQVACVIELKARFDEERNLHWATELERAGAHVTVGDVRLKTHAKVALVVRQEAAGLRSYAHIGSGNYHVRTARLYTDVGLLTCNPAITGEVVQLFHHLTGRSELRPFRNVVVAPTAMRQRFLELIAREVEHHRAGRPARIVAKMNQLEDTVTIAALRDASQAGLPIELIVRGFCCLRPGVPGHTETIQVRSIIGRFLEHSRIFYFAAGRQDPLEGEFFIGSGDWMHRNLSGRVEVAVPVTDAAARAKLWEILTLCLADRRQAWLLAADGEYSRLEPAPDEGDAAGLSTQHTLMTLTRQRWNDAP